MANQPASGVSYSADGKTLTVHGQTLNYVFTYTGAVPLQASDLAATEQRLTAAVPNPAPSFAAVQLSLAAILARLVGPGPGSLGAVSLRQTGGKGGTLTVNWKRGDPADVPPTIEYNGVPLAVSDEVALTP